MILVNRTFRHATQKEAYSGFPGGFLRGGGGGDLFDLIRSNPETFQAIFIICLENDVEIKID